MTSTPAGPRIRELVLAFKMASISAASQGAGRVGAGQGEAYPSGRSDLVPACRFAGLYTRLPSSHFSHVLTDCLAGLLWPLECNRPLVPEGSNSPLSEHRALAVIGPDVLDLVAAKILLDHGHSAMLRDGARERERPNDVSAAAGDLTVGNPQPELVHGLAAVAHLVPPAGAGDQ